MQKRWNCPHCGTEGWSSDGAMPPHDTRNGVSCRPSGQISEKRARARFRVILSNQHAQCRIAGAVRRSKREAYRHAVNRAGPSFMQHGGGFYTMADDLFAICARGMRRHMPRVSCSDPHGFDVEIERIS